MNRLDRLAELQTIDMRIDESNRSRREAEVHLGDDTSLLASQKTFDDAHGLVNEIRARLRALELEGNGIDDKIKQVESRLYNGSTTNPKELTGLELDAEMLKRQKNELEDRMLEGMAQLETAEAAYASSRAALDKVSAEASAATLRARAVLHESENVAAKLTQARAQLCGQVAPADLAIYENLRREKKGRALARLKGTACEVCGFSIPSGLASRARVGQELEFCSNCGRILIP